MVARASRLVCYDDAHARAFEPFALTRPWSEMRVGALLVRERWQHVSGCAAQGFIAGASMRDFVETGAPRASRGVLPAGTLVANSRCAVSLDAALSDAGVYRCGDRVAAVRLSDDIDVNDLADGTLTLEQLAKRLHGRARGVTIHGVWCDHVWDTIGALNPLLAADIPVLARAHHATALAPGAIGEVATGLVTIIGDHPVWLDAGAQVEPQVVFDTSAGPVFLSAGARVQAFSRVSGPCFVGRDTIIAGGRVGGSALGDVCKVHGEVSACVFVGHANKGHDGFVGHSVLGRWVNLGAGTTTSNLKNTYGTVSLWTPTGIVDSGLQFLGTMFGDHVKTGIGLRLTTGCVLGAGANVVDRMPPKAVEPFAWGAEAPYSTYDADKFLETAARVMSRRHVELGATMKRHLSRAHEHRWTLP